MISRELRELIVYHSKFTRRFAEHDYHNVFAKTFGDLKLTGLRKLEGRHVLDLGCGQRFPFALLCAAEGARVTALDIDYVKPDPLPRFFYNAVRHNGVKRAFKSAIRQVLFDRRYYTILETTAKRPLKQRKSAITYVIADPGCCDYPLRSGTFDLIVSNAVVEHVNNVNQFAAEIYRLLVKGGYFYAIIHNFYSLSGGHNLEWAYPDESPSKRVPPWDHLRRKEFQSWVFLNKLKPEEYANAFKTHLEVLLFEPRNVNHDRNGCEGERFLRPEITAELKEYPRELLLTRSWCIIARKRD